MKFECFGLKYVLKHSESIKIKKFKNDFKLCRFLPFLSNKDKLLQKELLRKKFCLRYFLLNVGFETF